MLRYFRLNLLEFQLSSNVSVLQVVSLALVIVCWGATSALGPDALGQEPSNEPEKTAVLPDDDAGPDDLLAAIKSLDNTLNKKDVLARRKQMRDRLIGFGVLGGALLALLGVLFAYLRLDHATRGFHSGRLQLLAGLMSVLILGTCYFLWTQVLFQ